MNTKGVIVIIVIVVLIVGGIFLLGRDGTDTTLSDGNETTEALGVDTSDETNLTGSEGDGADSDIIEGETEGTSLGQTLPPNEDGTVTDDTVLPSTIIEVTYSTDGFIPSKVIIKAGDTVTWTNETDRPMWVASAVHPTHTVYPEKTSNDCLGSSFDACKGVAVGETFTFTFNEVGEWGYHDHLKASRRGTVIVE